MRTLAVLLGLNLPVLACSCRSLEVCELQKQPVIFIGEVVDGGISSLKDDPWHSAVKHATFKVVESFRGLPPGTNTVDVKLLLWPGMCSPIPYQFGRKYLVVPWKRDGILGDGVCFSGRDVEEVPDQVRNLREYFTRTAVPNIRGRIAVARESGIVDFRLRTGEAKPGTGARVYATQGWSVYSAEADAEGAYFLAVPGAGRYKMRVELPPYDVMPPSPEVEVQPDSCTIQDFALKTDNTVSGRVWDHSGKVVMNAAVGLIDIEHGQAKRVDTNHWQHKDGTFEFSNVAPGRYLLMLNPKGPRESLPVESTYYPLASSRSEAKIIEIKGNHTHLTWMDLVVGPRVAFRNVNVHVRFTDGTPMTTASVRCVGEPNGSGNPEWMDYRVTRDKGQAVFVAPANRRIRIYVTDWYGRDMKATYSDTFEAGTSAITKEFVTKP